MPRAAARGLSSPPRSSARAFLAWTVAVAVDRNDKRRLPAGPAGGAGIAGRPASPWSFVYRRRSGLAFAATALGVVLLVATLFTSLYPRVMVSSPDFANSLTVVRARRPRTTRWR